MRVILGVVLLFVVTHGLDKLIGPFETSLNQNKLVAAIPVLAKSYKISFDLKPNSYSLGFRNVIRFTVGKGFTENGAPALWFQEDEHNPEEFRIATSINGVYERKININALPLNEWTNIVISQQLNNSKYIFTIDLNGTNVFTEKNNKPQKFNNLKVFASGPSYLSHNGSIKNLILENGKPGESLAEALGTKYYVFNNGVVKLKKNNLVASLSALEKSFDISFDLKLNSFSDGYRSVIHLTPGEDNAMVGDRIPGIWIFNKKLHVVFALNWDHRSFTSELPLPLNKWMNVKINQSLEYGIYKSVEYGYFKVYINHKKVYEVQNVMPLKFENIDVYAGDPWYEAQDGSIKNFNVWNSVGNVESKKSLKKDAIRKKPFGYKF